MLTNFNLKGQLYIRQSIDIHKNQKMVRSWFLVLFNVQGKCMLQNQNLNKESFNSASGLTSLHHSFDGILRQLKIR